MHLDNPCDRRNLASRGRQPPEGFRRLLRGLTPPARQVCCKFSRKRPGKILVLFALLLPVLLGLVGLVIDTGLMFAAHRQAKNAADAAALAAAMDLMLGNSANSATTTAQTFVQQYNGLANAPLPQVNIPPSQGPNATNANYVEVIVTNQVNTWFIQVLGANPTYTVQARAVAGFEPVNNEGLIALDPRAQPGLSVSGGGALRVDGSIVINSWSAGWDQYGNWVDWSYPGYAAASPDGSPVQARYLQVRGGVDVVVNYTNFSLGGPNPLFCRARIVADPLRNLPVPTQANAPSISDWTRNPAVEVFSGQSQTFSPGVYTDIQIDDGATATFNPGVYILSPDSANQGLRMLGACTVTGTGVLFYITGSDYLTNSPGYYDGLDGAVDLDYNTGQLPPAPDAPGTVYAAVDSNATGSIQLSGLQDAASPFNNLLFFQRRRNQNVLSIQSGGSNIGLGGIVYAKWANLKLAGGGSYNAQFLAGSLNISGQANTAINNPAQNFGTATQVFLVE